MYIKKILLIIAVMGIIALSVFSYYVYTSIFGPNTSFKAQTAIVHIPTGATYRTVLDSLKNRVENIESFNSIAEKKAYPGNIKAGRFILHKGMNNNEIINTLRSTNAPVKVNFNNQERVENLAGRIASQIEADSLSLLEVMQDSAFLKENDISRAQALSLYIPNQYEFFWNTSAKEFRTRMKKEYDKFWNSKRIQKAKDIGLSLPQVITLASIVQKETAKVEERPRVAGVYINRFKKGWKLEADPTVIYAIKKETNKFDTIIKRVLYKDLELDSPYNTYKYTSLPPGPITMPDISSIDAVLNYEHHDFYYFVASVEKFGYHKFSKTLAEHNRNKQEYVRWLNKNGYKR